MINLLLGPPGGGKSYEATVFHVLPALAKGRLVITNLPLDLERLAQIDPGYPDLVVKVEGRRGQADRTVSLRSPLNRAMFSLPVVEDGLIRAFASIADYAHPWRHQETGSGPLYVIDECHLAMPRGGTSIEVEEWFSLHRHESADVLLITQSHGKVSKSIIDLVQICYRVKKATAFGSEKKYVRKVQDGVRGDVVNTSIRTYEKRYFGLYKSHTRGGGSELEAQDIVPFWQRWPFIGLALCIMIFIGMMASGVSINPLKSSKPKEASVQPVRVVEERIVDGKVVTVSDTAEDPVPVKTVQVEAAGTPFEGHTLHVIGTITRNGGISKVLFSVATGDRFKMEITSDDLRTLGYTVDVKTGCAVHLKYENWAKWAICDSPMPERIPGGAMDLPESQRSRPVGEVAQGPVPDRS